MTSGTGESTTARLAVDEVAVTHLTPVPDLDASGGGVGTGSTRVGRWPPA